MELMYILYLRLWQHQYYYTVTEVKREISFGAYQFTLSTFQKYRSIKDKK